VSRGFVANGNISPSRLVKIDPTAPGKVLQCSAASDVAVGVCQAGTHNASVATFDDGYAAVAGLNVNVFTVGDLCQVQSGGTITAGDRLTSDSSGRAVTASSGNYTVGYAEQNATAADQMIQMRVQPGLI